MSMLLYSSIRSIFIHNDALKEWILFNSSVFCRCFLPVLFLKMAYIEIGEGCSLKKLSTKGLSLKYSGLYHSSVRGKCRISIG